MALVPSTLEASQDDIDGVMRAARDYIEGYTSGDPGRHARAYHPECVKRRYAEDQDSGIFELITLPPRVMADFAGTDDAVITDCEYEVVIDAISQDIASVRVYSCRWVDFLHVVKARGEWKLFHVTWHRQPGA